MTASDLLGKICHDLAGAPPAAVGGVAGIRPDGRPPAVSPLRHPPHRGPRHPHPGPLLRVNSPPPQPAGEPTPPRGLRDREQFSIGGSGAKLGAREQGGEPWWFDFRVRRDRPWSQHRLAAHPCRRVRRPPPHVWRPPIVKPLPLNRNERYGGKFYGPTAPSIKNSGPNGGVCWAKDFIVFWGWKVQRRMPVFPHMREASPRIDSPHY